METLKSLGIAFWGACWGVFLSSVYTCHVAKTIDRAPVPVEGLVHDSAAVQPFRETPWQERLETTFFKTSYLAAPLGGLIALLLLGRVCHAGAGFLCALLACLFQFKMMGKLLTDRSTGTWQWLTLLCLSFPLLLALARHCAAWGVSERWLNKWEWVRGKTLAALPTVLGLLTLQALVAFLFLPSYPTLFGRHIGTNSHMGSFIFGPSLYFFGDGLIPGKDFESHYGLGHAYLFYLLRPASFPACAAFFFQYLFFFLSVFFLTGFLVLRHFFKSSLSAWVTCLLLLMLCLESNNYATPSNWPIRFPFLFLFIGACAKTSLWGRAWPAVALSGVMGGLSFFWQTDIGLYFLLSGFALHLLSLREGPSKVYKPALFLAFFLGTFLFLLAAVYSPKALSLRALQGILEPLLYYSQGFGYHLMSWRGGWSFAITILLPLMALGTLALSTFQLLKRAKPEAGTTASAAQEFRYLFLFSAIGLIMLFKWINRSIDVVWFVNAYPLAAVFVWSCRQGAKGWADHVTRTLPAPSSALQTNLVRMGGAAIGLGFFSLCLFASLFHNPNVPAGSSSPIMRMRTFVSYYPTYASRLSGGLKLGPPPALPVEAEDVRFIQENSGAREPVTIISHADWIYLLEAQRSPRFYWVQFILTHSKTTFDKNLESLNRSDKVFIEKGALDMLNQYNPTLHGKVMTVLRAQFAPGANSNRLHLYHRIGSPGQLAGRSSMGP